MIDREHRNRRTGIPVDYNPSVPKSYGYERIAPLMGCQRLSWLEEEADWIKDELELAADNPGEGSDEEAIVAVYRKILKVRKLIRILQRDQEEWMHWYIKIQNRHQREKADLPAMIGEGRRCSDAQRLNHP